MSPFASQFSASVARRDQVVKNRWVGAVPRTAAATASPSSRLAANGAIRASRPLGSRQSPETQPSASRRSARSPPLIPVTPTMSAWPLMPPVCRADRAAAHLAVDESRRDDQEALEDVLPFLVEAEEYGGVENLHAQAGAHEGADERSAATEQARPAEDHGGYRGQGVVFSLSRVADSELREQDDRAEEGQERSADVTDERCSVHRDSDAPGRLLVRPERAQP